MTFIGVISCAAAQNNIISFEPIRLWNGLRFKYERVLGDRFTAGTQATIYYGNYSGYQISPLARFYFKRNAPEGFYAQAKIPLGLFKNEYTAFISDDGTNIPIRDYYGNLINGEVKDKKQTFFNAGLGLAVGWQMLFGKTDNWSLDFNMGVKFVSGIPEPEDVYVSEYDFTSSNAWSNTGWYLTAPGSIFDVLLTIGYRF